MKLVTPSRFLILAISLLGLLPGAFAAQNLLYINSNITATGQNTVIALKNDGAGNMTPVAGSPFATGGTGVAGMGSLLQDVQWDSDGEIAINAAGTLLFTVNGHSNDFSGFDLNTDGSLTALPGSPFPSRGTQPASIAYKDNGAGNGISLMVMANKDSDPFQTQSAPNYTTFRVDASGVPTPIAGSTLVLPPMTSPWQIILPKNSQYFFGIQFTGDTISTYRLSRNGTIKTNNTLPVSGDNGGGILNPKASELYVTMPAARLLNVVSYDSAYALSLVKTLPSSGKAPCWATMNKAGTRLYVAETSSGSVTVYDTTDAANPIELQHIRLAGTRPYTTHVRLDTTEKFLYVLDRQAVLHVLDIEDDGTVTENTTPYNLGLPLGTVPLGLASLRK